MQTDVQNAEPATLQSVLLELRKMNERQERLTGLDGDVWDIEQIGYYLNLAKNSVYKLIKDKSFPRCIVLPTGGKRWRARDVRAWFDKRS